jgi:hypothetical protein
MFDFDDPRDADLLKDAIRDALVRLHVAFPAIVVSYDAATRRAALQPVFKARSKAGAELRAPQLQGVPVAFPGGAGGGLTWALAAGDEVIVIVSERRLARWLERGGEVDPWEGADLGVQLPALHRLDDGIAIPAPLSNARAAARPSTTDGVTLEAQGAAPVKLGADDAAAGVALGDKVDSNTTAITTRLGLIEAWMASVGTAVGVPWTASSVSTQTTQSAKVKTK